MSWKILVIWMQYTDKVYWQFSGDISCRFINLIFIYFLKRRWGSYWRRALIWRNMVWFESISISAIRSMTNTCTFSLKINLWWLFEMQIRDYRTTIPHSWQLLKPCTECYAWYANWWLKDSGNHYLDYCQIIIWLSAVSTVSPPQPYAWISHESYIFTTWILFTWTRKYYQYIVKPGLVDVIVSKCGSLPGLHTWYRCKCYCLLICLKQN